MEHKHRGLWTRVKDNLFIILCVILICPFGPNHVNDVYPVKVHFSTGKNVMAVAVVEYDSVCFITTAQFLLLRQTQPVL